MRESERGSGRERRRGRCDFLVPLQDKSDTDQVEA
jgi:hypothetical protein